jgi:putative ABC transport system permease protein
MFEWLDRLVRNVPYGVRVLARTPSFTLTAITSLALAIAVNTTMFSVVSSLLLRPLGAYDDLVRIGRSGSGERAFRSASHQDLLYLREHATSFASITGHQLVSLRLRTNEGLKPLSGEIVAQNYFSTLGVSPKVGRDFVANEHDVPGHVAVAVLSNRFWRWHFAADRAIVGQQLTINEQQFTIIGVAPPGFTGTFPGVDIDVWLPAGLAWTVDPSGDRNSDPFLLLLGRLRDGVSQQAAEAELAVLGTQLDRANPDADGERRFVLASARGAHPVFANVLRVFLSLLMAVVAVVLLIACANVAGLLLTRAGARRREIAVRLSLGASRAQVVGQLLVESVLLATLGGVTGLLLTILPLTLLNRMSFIPGPTGAGVFLDLRLETRVLVFTALVSMFTAMVFGLLPALHATRTALTSVLRDARSSRGPARFRLGSAMIVTQVCVSFLLLVGALLLFRSLHNAGSIDVGFDPDQLVVTTVDLSQLGYDPARIERFHAALLARARELPGIEQAALASFLAFGEGKGHPQRLRIPGRLAPRGEPQHTVFVGRVSDSYFATVRQRLLHGRDFVAADRARTGVAIINVAMATRYWPGGDALGKRIGLGEDLAEREIVGIVANTGFISHGSVAQPLVFVPAQDAGTLHVRTVGKPADVVRSIRRLVQEIDANAVPYVSGQSMRESMGSSMSLVPLRLARVVFGVAGNIALLLAAGGLFGLVSYTTERRMKEIGIRVAMGANRSRVFSVLVGSAVRLTGVGLIVGIAIAAGVMRLLSRLLYGLSPIDPLTFGAIAGLLALVTLGAGYIAARRALGVDPMVILRYE